MPGIIRLDANTTERDLIAGLARCSVYAQSPERTRSTDVLLDLLLDWAGFDEADADE